MKRRPIVLLTRAYGAQPQATATRLAVYTAALRRVGQSVVVLTRFPVVDPGASEQAIYRERLCMREEIKGIAVHRYRLPGEAQLEAALSASLEWICKLLRAPRVKGMEVVDVLFTLMALPRLLRLRPCLLILEQGPAWLGIPARVCRWLGIPVVAQVSDIKSEQMRRGQYGEVSASRIAMIERLEASVYACATEIVTVTPSMREIISKRAGLPLDRIHWIPNGAELEFIGPADPSERSRRKAQLGFAGEFLAIYAGTFGPAHDLERVVEAARDLAAREDGERIVFLFLGSGKVEQDLKDLVGEYALDCVRFLPGVPIEELGSYLAAADIGLSPEVGGLEITLRAKLFACMAAGLSLLVTDDGGEARQLVERSQCGVLVSPGSTDAIVEAILALKARTEHAAKLGRNGRFHVEQHHDRRETASRFACVAMAAIAAAEGAAAAARPEPA